MDGLVQTENERTDLADGWSAKLSLEHLVVLLDAVLRGKDSLSNVSNFCLSTKISIHE